MQSVELAHRPALQEPEGRLHADRMRSCPPSVLNKAHSKGPPPPHSYYSYSFSSCSSSFRLLLLLVATTTATIIIFRSPRG